MTAPEAPRERPRDIAADTLVEIATDQRAEPEHRIAACRVLLEQT